MRAFEKVKNFIMQDVKNANETKRAAVITRMFALMMCVYFFVQGVAMSICGEWMYTIICLLCFCGYVWGFYNTYQDRTRITIFYTVVSTVGWIFLCLILFGWDCGAQHFVFVLLIFFFLTSHAVTMRKVWMAVVLCAVRLFLFQYTRVHAPIVPLEEHSIYLLQYINTGGIFCMITVMIMLFCQNSLAMEQKLVMYNAKLKEASRRDPLTGLYNRRAMLEYLDKVIEDTERYGKWFNVALGDIDFFKKINDKYGHEAGDAVLKHVADLLRAYMKSRGSVARWGGEEFLFVFRDINGEEAAIELEKIRSIIENSKIEYNGQEISVTMTFGIDEYFSNHPIDYTISNADKKLYMGKERGRNRVIF